MELLVLVVMILSGKYPTGEDAFQIHPDSNVHGANMGPTWGRPGPGGPHVGHVNLAIWVIFALLYSIALRSVQETVASLIRQNDNEKTNIVKSLILDIPNPHTYMLLVSSCRCLCAIY